MDLRTPLSIPDLFVGSLAALLFLVAALVLAAGSRERNVLLAATLAKVCYCFLFCTIGIHVFYGGDMQGYHDHGIVLADRIRRDFPEGLIGYLQDEPFFLPSGNNTARCRSFSALVHVLTFDSYVASSLVFAMLGFTGQILIYRTFRRLYPDPRVRNWWRAGILFLPSFNFWSSGMLKDTLGLFGLGCAFWGLHALVASNRARYLLVLASGLYTLHLFRGQAIPVLLVSAVPLLFGTLPGQLRSSARPRKARRLVLLGAIAAVFVLVARSDQRFAFSGSTLDDIARERGRYALQAGGSTVLDRQGEDTGRGGLALLAFWPEAVVLTLYRPFLFEGFSSPIMLLAALENSLFLFLSLRVLFRSFRKGMAGALLRSPVLLECLAFVFVFAFALGFSTPNLGSISRYRLPLVPYFVGVVTIMEALRLPRVAGRSG